MSILNSLNMSNRRAPADYRLAELPGGHPGLLDLNAGAQLLLKGEAVRPNNTICVCAKPFL